MRQLNTILIAILVTNKFIIQIGGLFLLHAYVVQSTAFAIVGITVKKEDAVSICNEQLVVMWRINVPSYVMYKIYIAPKQEETNLLIVGVISE
jgi:hypothetical protein